MCGGVGRKGTRKTAESEGQIHPTGFVDFRLRSWISVTSPFNTVNYRLKVNDESQAPFIDKRSKLLTKQSGHMCREVSAEHVFLCLEFFLHQASKSIWCGIISVTAVTFFSPKYWDDLYLGIQVDWGTLKPTCGLIYLNFLHSWVVEADPSL